MMRTVMWAFSLLAALVLAMVAGSVHLVHRYISANTLTVGPTEVLERTFEPRDVTRLDLAVEMMAGELVVKSRPGPPAVQATLSENINELSSSISYTEREHIGRVTIQPSGTMGIPPLNQADVMRFVWDVELGQALPVSMTVELGMGTADLDLRALPLSTLQVDVGLGESTVDLRGVRTAPLTAVIDGGTGAITVLLPVDVGVRVDASVGMGDVTAEGLTPLDEEDSSTWVNARYGEGTPTIKLSTDMGLGDITLLAGAEEE